MGILNLSSLHSIKSVIKKPLTKVSHLKYTYVQKYVNRRLSIAHTYSKQEKYDVASSIIKDIVKKHSKHAPPSLYIKLSEYYNKQKLYEKQIDILNLAIHRHPSRIRAYVELVNLFIDLGKYDSSVDVWKKISKLFDTEVKINLWPKFSRKYVIKDQFDFSEKILIEGLSNYPGQTDLTVELADTFMHQKKYKDALIYLKPIVDNFNNNPTANLSSLVIRARYFNSIATRILEPKEYKKSINNYKKHSKIHRRNRIAVFTCVTGDYDSIPPHEVIDSNIDYILFTDQPIRTTGIYKIKSLPFHHDDPIRASRYVKTHPHILLPEYDIAIWIDANVMITGDLQKYVKILEKSKKAIGSIPHPNRKTLYEEAEACIDLGKDDVVVIKKQISEYRKAGYKGADMIESGFVIFNMTNPGVNKFLNLWWEQIDTFSRRDQLSFSVALDKAALKWKPLMNSPNNIRNNQDFILVPHNGVERFGDTLAKDILNKKKITPSLAYEDVVLSSRIKSIDIIVCIHNAISDVKRCLDSIVANSPIHNINLILIDDGSLPETVKYLNEFSEGKKWVKVYRNKSAQGYTKAANRGISKSKADFLVLLNSDTIVTRGWIEKLSKSVQLYPNVGIVGPLSSAASHQSIPDNESSHTQTAVNNLPNGIDSEGMNKFCEEWSKNIPFPMVPLVHGFCFGITRQLINAIGKFDEYSFPYGYGEENDYCFRATNAGFSMVVSLDTYIFHSKSKSYSDDDRRINLMKTGAQTLANLHGKDRITRAILTMNSNPSLKNMRKKAESLYR